MKMSTNKKKMYLFLMSQWSSNPNIRFLGQKLWPVGRAHTDTRTHRVTTSGVILGTISIWWLRKISIRFWRSPMNLKWLYQWCMIPELCQSIAEGVFIWENLFLTFFYRIVDTKRFLYFTKYNESWCVDIHTVTTLNSTQFESSDWLD